MNQRNERQGFIDLVPLQVADEVPASLGHRGGLLPEFLRPALAEIGDAEAGEKSCDAGGDGLRDGDEGDAGGVAVRPGARRGDAGPDRRDAVMESRTKIVVIHSGCGWRPSTPTPLPEGGGELARPPGHVPAAQ